MMRAAPLFIAALALAGCSSRVEQISVTVLTKGCSFADGTASPSAATSVDHYQVSITGQGLTDAITTSFAASGDATVPAIPPGSARVMTIQGFTGDPTGSSAVLRSSGVSQPFDVPATVGTPVKVTVVLRPAGVFSGVNQAGSPGKCAELTYPRAGHTATLLQDGTVLITGGFSGDAGNEEKWTFLPQSEIFDPRTGAVTAAAPMAETLPYTDGGSIELTVQRAFHSATLLPSGQVIVLGGEVSSGSTADAGPNGNVETQQLEAVYNPPYDSNATPDSWIFQGASAGVPRSRHAAIYDAQSNSILLVGGVIYPESGTGPVAATTPVRWWYGENNTFSEPVLQLGTTTPAVFGGIGSSIAQWQSTFVGSGGFNTEGTEEASQPTIGFIQWVADGGAGDGGASYDLFSEGDIQEQEAGMPMAAVSMSPARSGVAMVSLTQNTNVLVAGGFTPLDGGGGTPVKNVQNISSVPIGGIVAPAINDGQPLTHALGDLCGVALSDGRAFTAGGDDGTETSTDSNVWAINSATGLPTTSTTPTPMFYARKWHTCTLLQDGSVAVIGGVDTRNGGFKMLGSIEIYTPVPLPTAN